MEQILHMKALIYLVLLKKCEKPVREKNMAFYERKGLEKMVSTFSSRFGIFHTPLSFLDSTAGGPLI